MLDESTRTHVDTHPIEHLDWDPPCGRYVNCKAGRPPASHRLTVNLPCCGDQGSNLVCTLCAQEFIAVLNVYHPDWRCTYCNKLFDGVGREWITVVPL